MSSGSLIAADGPTRASFDDSVLDALGELVEVVALPHHDDPPPCGFESRLGVSVADAIPVDLRAPVLKVDPAGVGRELVRMTVPVAAPNVNRDLGGTEHDVYLPTSSRYDRSVNSVTKPSCV